MYDAALIKQILALVPAQHLPAFFALTTRDGVTKAEWQTTIQDALDSLDGETQRRQVGRLLSSLLPLEALIPDIYHKWRPIVRDGVAFIGAHLSNARLAAKLAEELNLLRGLADFLDLQPYREILSQAGLRELCNDICNHLAEEVNFPGEQTHLIAAAQQYANVAGVRVPERIAALSTPAVTAMTEAPGVKVTDAFLGAPKKRRRVATHLIEALLAVPLFAQAPEAILHADPHAGNLLCDEDTGDVILVDWSLTERLSREERRQLMLLISAVCLRDAQRMYHALEALSTDNLRHDPSKARFVRRHVRRFLRQLSPYTIPGMVDVLPLLDRLMVSGIGFSNSLLILGKILFTLKGVLHDLAPGLRITPVLMWYMLSQGRVMAHQHPQLDKSAVGFRSPLSGLDWLTLSWSALWYSSRVWQQCAEQVWVSHPLSRTSTERG